MHFIWLEFHRHTHISFGVIIFLIYWYLYQVKNGLCPTSFSICIFKMWAQYFAILLRSQQPINSPSFIKINICWFGMEWLIYLCRCITLIWLLSLHMRSVLFSSLHTKFSVELCAHMVHAIHSKVGWTSLRAEHVTRRWIKQWTENGNQHL
jgi:hypothetical protein